MIDIDKLFEDYFRKFIAENAGKFTESELENKVAEIYTKFGNTKLKALEMKTPIEFFSEMSSEDLVRCLESCVKDGIPVSDYLCEALENRVDTEDMLIEFVSEDVEDELATYSANILKSQNSKKALSRFIDVVKSGKASESLIESVTEALTDNANEVKDEIIKVYDKNDKSSKYFVEVLASTTPCDDVFNILIDEFKSHTSEIALYATYLSKYGDDRALPVLYEAISKDSVSYIDFKELKLAIEALGGEYEENRDFKKDKTFNKIIGN